MQLDSYHAPLRTIRALSSVVAITSRICRKSLSRIHGL